MSQRRPCIQSRAVTAPYKLYGTHASPIRNFLAGSFGSGLPSILTLACVSCARTTAPANSWLGGPLRPMQIDRNAKA